MSIETAIKNIVCNESVNGLKPGTFEHIYKERMRDNTTNTKLQSKRLKLRNSVYSKLSTRYHDEESSENITLYSLTDYILIVCCLLKRVDFSSKSAKQLVHVYKSQNQLLHVLGLHWGSHSVAPFYVAHFQNKLCL